MTTDRELSDEAKAEIADAVRIIAEDKFYQRMMSNTPKPLETPIDTPKDPEPTNPETDPTGPQSPPPKDIPEPAPEKKKVGLYWGSEE